jgi:hypothetical protein
MTKLNETKNEENKENETEEISKDVAAENKVAAPAARTDSEDPEDPAGIPQDSEQPVPEEVKEVKEEAAEETTEESEFASRIQFAPSKRIRAKEAKEYNDDKEDENKDEDEDDDFDYIPDTKPEPSRPAVSIVPGEITGVLLPEQILPCLPSEDVHSDSYNHTYGGYQISMRYNGDPRIRTCVPRGAMLRLLIAYINGQAVKTQSQTVRLESVQSLLRAFGLPMSGEKYFDLRTQADLLAKTTFCFIFREKRNGRPNPTGKSEIISGVRFITKDEEGYLAAQLSDKYYQRLLSRGLPVDLKVMGVLSGNCLAMDAYTWLIYTSGELVRSNRRLAIYPTVQLLKEKFRISTKLWGRKNELHSVLCIALRAVTMAVPEAGEVYEEDTANTELTVRAASLYPAMMPNWE